jgi:hypothetical protein
VRQTSGLGAERTSLREGAEWRQRTEMVTLAGSRHSTRVVYGQDFRIEQLALLLPFHSKTGQTSAVVSVKRTRFSLLLSRRNKPTFHYRFSRYRQGLRSAVTVRQQQ